MDMARSLLAIVNVGWYLQFRKRGLQVERRGFVYGGQSHDGGNGAHGLVCFTTNWRLQNSISECLRRVVIAPDDLIHTRNAQLEL
jgi:hypothetical protein